MEIIGNSIVLALISLRYKKGVPFRSWHMKAVFSLGILGQAGRLA